MHCATAARFLGCTHKECQLCKNNPNKRCGDDDNFDECFADGQVRTCVLGVAGTVMTTAHTQL